MLKVINKFSAAGYNFQAILPSVTTGEILAQPMFRPARRKAQATP
jgi:hypothetical protein